MSDDAPSLGGQSDDLSPMISSVQTRVIADARGAYLAGNFKALIEMLSDEQQQQFRKVIYRQAAGCVVEGLRQLPEAKRSDPTVGDFLPFAEAVANWAHDPGYDIPDEIDNLAGRLAEVDEEEEAIPEYIYVLLEGVLERDLRVAADDAVIAAVDIGAMDDRRDLLLIAEKVLEHWHLETAWHLLRGVPLPVAPDISPPALEALARDLPHMYEMQNLEALLGGMDASQAARLRQEVLRQTVLQMKALLSNHTLTQQMKNWLVEFEACASEGSTNPVERYPIIRAALLASPDKSRELFLLQRLSDVFDSVLGMEATIFGVTYQSALCMRLAARTAYPGMNNLTLEKSIHTWHLEAAWAILNNTPIPPLELAP
jgi:hypothetical protein